MHSFSLKKWALSLKRLAIFKMAAGVYYSFLCDEWSRAAMWVAY
jgi:hypothetical protein